MRSEFLDKIKDLRPDVSNEDIKKIFLTETYDDFLANYAEFELGMMKSWTIDQKISLIDQIKKSKKDFYDHWKSLSKIFKNHTNIIIGTK